MLINWINQYMHQGWHWANCSTISSGLISMLVWQYYSHKAFSHSWPNVLLSGVFNNSLTTLTKCSHSEVVMGIIAIVEVKVFV